MNIFRFSVPRTLGSRVIVQGSRNCPPWSRGFGEASRNADAGGLSSGLRNPAPFHPLALKPFDNLRLPERMRGGSRLPPNHEATPFANLVTSMTETLTNRNLSHSYTISHLISLLNIYSSQPSHWQKYAHANPAKPYTRNLICEVPGIFHLLVLVWTPGKMSAIHDHAGADCLMKVLQGELLETRYAFPDQSERKPVEALTESSREVNRTNSLSYMTDDLGLHSVANSSPTQYSVSLHLYTPPNVSMRGCHIYDKEMGFSRHVQQGPYDTIGGVLQSPE